MVWAVTGCAAPGEPPAADGTLTIVVRGEDYAWSFRFAGPDGRFDSRDDRVSDGDLHLPLGVPVELLLQSGDYVYTFAVAEFGVKEIAVPGLDFRARFRPTLPGEFTLLGDRMCGYDHEGLIRAVVVEPREVFDAWWNALPAG